MIWCMRHKGYSWRELEYTVRKVNNNHRALLRLFNLHTNRKITDWFNLVHKDGSGRVH